MPCWQLKSSPISISHFQKSFSRLPSFQGSPNFAIRCPMMAQAQSQVKVGVGVGVLWQALSKDMIHIIPSIIPNLVKEAKLIEGDGGLGTIILFTFGSDVPAMSYQKEQIVELDESQHRITLQVIEGGHLNLGFSSYKTTFQLTETREQETLADVTVAYATEANETIMPSKTTESALGYTKRLEAYLMKSAS